MTEDENELIAPIIEFFDKYQMVGYATTFPEQYVQEALCSTNREIVEIAFYALSCGNTIKILPKIYETLQKEYSDNKEFKNNIEEYLFIAYPLEGAENFDKENQLIKKLYKKGLKKWRSWLSCIDPNWTAEKSSTADMTIIVHGTWGAVSNWWQPREPFWRFLNIHRKNLYSGDEPFCWAGGYPHVAREKAARSLIEWCNEKAPANIDIVAHSHGGNVCIIAANLGLKIRNLILLGTPIRLEYIPEYKNIEKIHNVFSTRDRKQSPIGTAPNRRNEGKTLADTKTFINHYADDNGKGKGEAPNHTQLHEEKTWLACSLLDCFN